MSAGCLHSGVSGGLPPSGGSIFSSALRFRSTLISTYWLLVLTWACPSQSLTTKISFPASTRCRAVVWRKACGVMLRPCSEGQVAMAALVCRAHPPADPKAGHGATLATEEEMF